MLTKVTTRNTNDNPEHWDTIITPQRKWFEFQLRDIWHAHELIGLFGWRDLVSVYKQTVLGPLWYFLQPALQALMYFFIFGFIAKLPTDGIPPLVFYLAGTVLWGFFSNNISRVSSTFIGNSYLYGKVYFPRLVIPISVVISNFISFLIQILLLIAVMLIYISLGSTIRPNLWLLLIPVLLLIIAFLGFSLGIIVSALTVRYRDLQYFIGFAVQFLLYGTPIIYPLSAIPQSFRVLILINPLTSVFEAYRFALLGQGSINLPLLGYSFIFTSIIFILSLIAFNLVEDTFMDFV
jgi:lipopolysaccharide transport system permease protein